jgi:hypothetical protein
MTPWPSLPYEEWRESRDTLHMYTQVIGKLRLALSPFEPQWGNVPLYVTARGLTTSPMPIGARTLEGEFDFIENVLVLRTSDGGIERRVLGGAVADFYGDVMGALARLAVEVTLSVVPSEVPDPIPFPEDRTHRTYDPGQARRFWEVLAMIDSVLREHRAAFRGRTLPVSFFWGTFDLALIRVSGRPVTPRPGAPFLERFGGNAEQVCAGWWPGDAKYPHAAFYAYAYPRPIGIEQRSIRPPEAGWSTTIGEFLMPYESARTSADPRATILEFLRSTYDVGAGLLGWPGDLTQIDAPGRGPRARRSPSARPRP